MRSLLAFAMGLYLGTLLRPAEGGASSPFPPYQRSRSIRGEEPRVQLQFRIEGQGQQPKLLDGLKIAANP